VVREEATSMKRTIATLWVLALVTGVAMAQDRWLHVRVQEFDRDNDYISINLPLSAVEGMLSGSEFEGLRNGKIHLGDHADFDGIDLREVLLALRDAPDSDFVTIRSREDSIRVAKEDGFLIVNVDETDGDRVRVRMPMEVVDVLLEAEDQEVDVVRILDALSVLDGTDLITVDSDDSRVRIWIDSYHDGE
jgi:hypothetical protein